MLQLLFIVDLEDLLSPGRRVGNVQLHDELEVRLTSEQDLLLLLIHMRTRFQQLGRNAHEPLQPEVLAQMVNKSGVRANSNLG